MGRNPEIWQWIAGYGILGSLLVLIGWGAIRSRRHQRLVQNTPTSKTAGVFIGLVEVKGSAESESPLVSELAQQRCVQFSWSVQEHWRRTVTESYTDSDGKRRTRTRTESGWTTLESGDRDIPFYLRDDTGILRILPEKARIEPATMFSETVGRGDPLYYSRGHHGSVMNSTHRRRFVERGIPLHHDLYVMGQSRERQDIAAAEIAHDDHAPLFLISTRTEEHVQKSMGGGFWGLLVLGMLLSAGGPWLVHRIIEPHAAENYPLLPGGITIAVFTIHVLIRWGLMVFNDLVGLKNRVSQAAANIDVQLRRRHDLIPRLMDVVRGLKDYESRLQSQLAQLRTQASASIPGQDGPDPESCQATLLAIAEAYPEIAASQAFLDLHHGITDTEERIALARNYFNDIVTHYNTRRETIPDQFFATLAGLKPIQLFRTGHFERAAIHVDLAD